LSRASIKQFKSWETGYSESSGSTYADPKPRNPDHVRRRNTPQPDNDAITKHLQDLLSPAIYAQSATEVWDSERILNLTLMVAAVLTLIWRQVPSVQLSRMLEQQELLWEKQSKSHNKHCHKGFSVFQPSCLSMFFMTCCHSYKHVGTKGKTTSSGRSQIRTQAF